MRNIALVVSIFLFVLGVWVSRKYQLETVGPQNQEVLSSQEEEKTFTPTPTTAVPLSTITDSPTPFPTSSPYTEINNFIYPGSKVIIRNSTRLMLESYENSDNITEWYKNKIENMGMNVKSFVTTRANDKVLNKLSGADGRKEINVEISKDQDSPLVKISVSFENS